MVYTMKCESYFLQIKQSTVTNLNSSAYGLNNVTWNDKKKQYKHNDFDTLMKAARQRTDTSINTLYTHTNPKDVFTPTNTIFKHKTVSSSTNTIRRNIQIIKPKSYPKRPIARSDGTNRLFELSDSTNSSVDEESEYELLSEDITNNTENSDISCDTRDSDEMNDDTTNESDSYISNTDISNETDFSDSDLTNASEATDITNTSEATDITNTDECDTEQSVDNTEDGPPSDSVDIDDIEQNNDFYTTVEELTLEVNDLKIKPSEESIYDTDEVLKNNTSPGGLNDDLTKEELPVYISECGNV